LILVRKRSVLLAALTGIAMKTSLIIRSLALDSEDFVVTCLHSCAILSTGAVASGRMLCTHNNNLTSQWGGLALSVEKKKAK
jgi:hypothetical protein